MSSLEEAINHIKVELMLDYDYDEYTRRHEEYEARLENGEFQDSDDDDIEERSEVESEDDISW